MVKKNGKELETLVRLIQETLKDSDNTIIYSNAKIKNESGRKREFDILIETKVNNFTVKIAIECKDYKRPVSVDKIEAFQGKCDRIPDINKKVFVSAKGYQKDAINAAKECGIDLYTVEDIDSSKILNWLPIKQLGLRVLLKNHQFAVNATEKELENLHSMIHECQFIFENEVIKDINSFVFDQIKEHKSIIWGINLLEFMRTVSNDRLGRINCIPFKIQFNNSAFIASSENVKFPVCELNGTVDTWLIETYADKITTKSFISNKEAEAKYISFDNAKFGKAEFIITSDNKRKMFHTDLEGNKMELQQLGIYDPKTDKYTPSEM